MDVSGTHTHRHLEDTTLMCVCALQVKKEPTAIESMATDNLSLKTVKMQAALRTHLFVSEFCASV